MGNRILTFASLAWALSTLLLVTHFFGGTIPDDSLGSHGQSGQLQTGVMTQGSSGQRWFLSMKPFCNGLEAELSVRTTPPPETFEGSAYAAACFALAGRIERARSLIEGLEGDQRWQAAGIVFGQAHPIADSGDDRSAGPIMELVVEFWPNHHQALYHAGAARYSLGDHAEARDYLLRFLEYYRLEDGWTRNAEIMLERMPG